MPIRRFVVAGIVAACVAAYLPSNAQDAGAPDKDALEKAIPSTPHYSPYAGRSFPTRPLFGDTHLHTALSLDAGASGTRLMPRDAYRFARGEEVTSSTGQRVKLSRPLDFLVVADHTDNMGLVTDLFAGKPEILADPQGRAWYDMILSGKVVEAATEMIGASAEGKLPKAMTYTPDTPAFRSVWHGIVEAAEEANEPGRFTAFIGFEWTSQPGGNNLHRNVIFREGGDRAGQVEPFTTSPPFGSDDPRVLWKWMAAYHEKTGGGLLAIPHNGNLSGGRMFPIVEPGTGKKIDREYAEQRSKWERLYEATQMKGDGETHPFLSPNDEFAEFERWDEGNLMLTEAHRSEWFEREYARAALENGLKLEAELGVNPFKFGLIGSTDSHTALSTAEEDNFFSKGAPYEPSAHRWEHAFMKSDSLGRTIMAWEMTASGYAAVWAAENTREAIFDAMIRREVYATTGPRMVVRFFGGWDFEPEDANDRLPARVGYTKGVPMGGDLRSAPRGKVPTFLVAAAKDPMGANLDRYQIVKGWLDSQGKLHEKVFDVAWGDRAGRRVDPGSGKLDDVGSTVDVASATWTNTIGDPELIAVWSDPDFDPSERAFYYGRVVEIPTPRWTAYDANHYGLKLPPEVPMTTRERAYTSPIWYTP